MTPPPSNIAELNCLKVILIFFFEGSKNRECGYIGEGHEAEGLMGAERPVTEHPRTESKVRAV